jgi:hypothetical protein
MKTNIGKVKYPETFAEKIRKLFNNNSKLYAKALEQVYMQMIHNLTLFLKKKKNNFYFF